MIDKLVEVFFLSIPPSICFCLVCYLDQSWTSFQVVSLAFSGNAVARSHFNRMEDKIIGLVAEVKRWRDAE